MTDNEKRAHDLALMMVDLKIKEISLNSTGDVPIDLLAIYIKAYNAMLNEINKIF